MIPPAIAWRTALMAKAIASSGVAMVMAIHGSGQRRPTENKPQQKANPDTALMKMMFHPSRVVSHIKAP